MKQREPLYWGKKAAKKKRLYLNSLSQWEQGCSQKGETLDFYVIKNPTNPANYMDILKISQLFENPMTGDSSSIYLAGIAASKKEAEDLAAQIIGDSYRSHGYFLSSDLFPEGQVNLCT